MITSPPIVLDYAGRCDLPALARIDAACGPYPWDVERIARELLKRGRIAQTATLPETDNTPIVVVGWKLYELSPLQIRLHRLGVDHDWRGHGIGSRFVNRLKDKVRNSRRRRLVTTVPESSVELCLWLKRQGFLAVELHRDHFEAGEDGIEFIWSPKLEALP